MIYLKCLVSVFLQFSLFYQKIIPSPWLLLAVAVLVLVMLMLYHGRFILKNSLLVKQPPPHLPHNPLSQVPLSFNSLFSFIKKNFCFFTNIVACSFWSLSIFSRYLYVFSIDIFFTFLSYLLWTNLYSSISLLPYNVYVPLSICISSF